MYTFCSIFYFSARAYLSKIRLLPLDLLIALNELVRLLLRRSFLLNLVHRLLSENVWINWPRFGLWLNFRLFDWLNLIVIIQWMDIILNKGHCWRFRKILILSLTFFSKKTTFFYKKTTFFRKRPGNFRMRTLILEQRLLDFPILAAFLFQMWRGKILWYSIWDFIFHTSLYWWMRGAIINILLLV